MMVGLSESDGKLVLPGSVDLLSHMLYIFNQFQKCIDHQTGAVV